MKILDEWEYCPAEGRPGWQIYKLRITGGWLFALLGPSGLSGITFVPDAAK